MCSAINISVVMPVHNGMPYLPETVESILGQTYGCFELVAIDDGSCDGTSQYLRSLEDPRVSYHRLDKVGLVEALNYGIEKAQAPLIVRIDADDVAHPERIGRQYEYMRENPSCVLLGCDFDEIDQWGRQITECNVMYRMSYMATTDVALRWQLLFGTPFLHPGVMFRKEQVRRVGGYRKIYELAEDYDLWVRLAGVGQFASIPEKLMKKRVHDNSISIGKENTFQIAECYAAQLSVDLDPVAMCELFWFYSRSRKPDRCTLLQLVNSYQTVRSLFNAHCQGDCLDLTEAIRATDETLRRRCLKHLRRDWYIPGMSLLWLRAMRGFDPKHGTLSDLFLRFIRKKIGKMSRVNTRPAAQAVVNDHL